MGQQQKSHRGSQELKEGSESVGNAAWQLLESCVTVITTTDHCLNDCGAHPPLIDGFQSQLVWNTFSLLKVQDEPGCPVGPLLCQVDPAGQSVPVEGDLISSQ